jgi:hypothetical protein
MLFFVIGWAVAYFAARRLRRHRSLESGSHLPCSHPFFIALVRAHRLVARQDELFRRIHLAGAGNRLPAPGDALNGARALRARRGLNPADWSYRHIWPFAVMFYYFGWLRAVKRYK